MSPRSHRPARPARRAPARRPRFDALEARELLTGYTVTSASDSGPGTLRDAIVQANTDNAIGADTISFSIAASGVQTIALLSPLPPITRTLVIDGATEPGYSTTNPSPQVVLDGTGAGAGADGLAFTGGGGSIVRGLSVVGFHGSRPAGGGGSGILLGGTANNILIQANDIGILPDGSTARPNKNGIVVNTSGNVIGGAGPSNANVISGNADTGILVAGTAASGNQISGNRIGTDASGFFEVGNTYGIILAGPNNTVGGTTPSAGNVISGNVGPTHQNGIGVALVGPATGNLVEGNLIGTDASGGTSPTGTGAVPNVYGIYLGTPGGSKGDNVAQETIGGTAQGAGNVISGNVYGITGNETAGLIAGNIIGLSSGGGKPVPNGDGIFLGATATTIGGTVAAARNVISGSNTASGVAGIGLYLKGDANLVQGNYFGLTSGGLAAAGSGNVTGAALQVTNSTIGGTVAGSGNAFGVSSGDALTLDDNGNDLVQGNLFGRSPVDQSAAPIGGNGIAITLPAFAGTGTAPLMALNDTIGGTAAGAGNTISGTAGSGIVTRAIYTGPVTNVFFRGNSISGTGKIGIDLNGSNSPIPGYVFVNSTAVSGTKVTVTGIIHGTPATNYDLDLFGNAANAPVDPTGFGPGQFFLGSTRVTTDRAGFAVFSPSFTAPSANLVSFSATSTGTDGRTSEFAANFPATAGTPKANLSVKTASSASSVTVGGLVTLTETVTNNGTATADNVVLNDALALSLANAKATTSRGSAVVDGNNVVTASIGPLNPGQSAVVTITANPNQVGPLLDTAGAASTTLDPDFSDNESTQSITVNPVPPRPTADLAITSTASAASTVVGSPLTYTVVVTNGGPSTATNVTINDFLPAGVTTVSASVSPGGTATVNGGTVVGTIGSIAPQASATLTIQVTPTIAGSLTNAANVSATETDPIAGNNGTSVTTAAVVVPRINLQLAASVYPTPVGIGQVQLFIFTLTNLGPDPATHATIIDALPTNSVFFVAAPSQGAAPSPVNGVLTDDLGTLAPGASATLTVAVVPTAAGPLVNFGGAYSPDFPTAAPSFAYGAVFVPAPPAPPPGPVVVGLAGFGKNSQLVLSFSEALEPLSATNPANYTLVATGPRGGNRRVAIVSATYNQLGHSVNLVPATPLDPTLTYRLVAIGTAPSGIVDARGRRLVGTPGGAAGTNYVADFYAGALGQV